MKTKTLIFDFDGTLADSMRVAIDIAHQLTSIPKLSDRQMAELRKKNLRQILRDLQIPLTHLPRLLIKGRRQMHRRMGEVKPFPGLDQALSRLSADGHELLVVSSNSEANVRIFLQANKLTNYFARIYGGVGLLDKAAALRKVLRKHRLDPKACFYIGDELRDVTAARKVGLKMIAVSWGYQDPQAFKKEDGHYVLVQKPDELTGIIS